MTSSLGTAHGQGSEPRPPRAEELSAALMSAAGDIAAVSIDSAGQVVQWGDGAARLLGHSAAETAGRHVSLLFPEEDRAAGAGRIPLERARTGTVEQRDWLVRKNGTRFLAEISWIPVRGDGGQPIGFLLVIRDLTERVQREARLRLLEAVVVSADDAVVITDPASRIEYVNAAYTRITGYTPDEVIGLRPSDFLHGPGTDAETTGRVRAAIRQQSPVRAELLNYRKDGSPFWIDISIVPVPDERGQVEHWASVQRETSARRGMEEELERLRHQQALLLESAGEGIYGLDAEGRTTFVNPAAAAMLGWDAADLIGKVQHDIIHHSHADGSPYLREECRIYEALADGKRHHEEDEVFWRKDGTSLPVEYTATPIRENGRVMGAVIVFEDVSARKAAERAQRRLTAIMEATPDCIWIADPDGRVHYLNRAGREMVGVGDDWIEGLTISDLHPDWAASRILREALPEAIRTGMWHGEAAVRHRSGHLTPVSQVVLAHGGPRGNVEYLSAIARDITERTRLEQVHKFESEASRALSASLDYGATLQTIASRAVPNLGDYCLIDLATDEGKVVRESAMHRDPARRELMDRLRRYPPAADGPLGASGVFRSGEPELVSEVTAAWLHAVSFDEAHHDLLAALDPRSEMIVPLRVRNRVIGVMTIGRVEPNRSYTREDLFLAEDFASRAALALDNARLYSEAQQATRIRDEVLGIVAHDLRNPLHTIRMSGELLLEATPHDAETPRRQLQIILRSAERANALIQDLLDVARMEAGRLTVELEPCAAEPIVDETVELHRALAAERHLELTAELPENLPRIRADRARLQQVLQNLIGNAIKFTPSGGHVTVAAAESANEVRFTVTDTGKGIAAADMTHLFDPFWQAKKSHGDGAGLGLAIAKGIVEAHGGRIWAESTPPAGAKFHFSIPKAIRREERPEPVDRPDQWRAAGDRL